MTEQNSKRGSMRIKKKNLKSDSQSQSNISPGLKSNWSPEEDMLLAELVLKFGEDDWQKISKSTNGKSPTECMNRWKNGLKPVSLKRAWTKEEDDLILSLRRKHGYSWQQIVKMVPGRTENAIKNRFYLFSNRSASHEKAESGLSASEESKFENEQDSDDCEEVGNLRSEVKNKKSDHQEDELMCVDESDLKFFDISASSFPSEIVEKEKQDEQEVVVTQPVGSQGHVKIKKKIIYPKNTDKEEGTSAKKSYYKSKKKLNRAQSDKFFETFIALQDAKKQTSISPTKEKPIQNSPPEYPTVTNTQDIYKPFPSKSQNSTTEIKDTKAKNSHNTDMSSFNIINSRLDSQIDQNMYPPHLTQTDSLTVKPRGLPMPLYVQNEDALTNSCTLSEQILGNQNFDFASRIRGDSLSNHLNGFAQANRLIEFSPVENKNIDSLFNMNQEITLPKETLGQTYEENKIKEVVTCMQETINCVSTIHSNYSQIFSDLIGSMLRQDTEDAGERIKYNLCQLSSLQRMIENIKGQMHNLKKSFGTGVETPPIIEEPINKKPLVVNNSPCKVKKPISHSITINIKDSKLDFEVITKKRLLG